MTLTEVTHNAQMHHSVNLTFSVSALFGELAELCNNCFFSTELFPKIVAYGLLIVCTDSKRKNPLFMGHFDLAVRLQWHLKTKL